MRPTTRVRLKREKYGRDEELNRLDEWFEGRSAFAIVSGIAGIGKSTLVAEWFAGKQDKQPNLSICWYPCQPWIEKLVLQSASCIDLESTKNMTLTI